MHHYYAVLFQGPLA